MSQTRHLVLVGACLLSLTQLATTSAADPLGVALKATGYVEIPLERTPGQLHVAVTVGDLKFRAHLDTGSTGSVLSQAVAKKLGLKLSENTSKHLGIGGTAEMRSTTLTGWSVGGLPQADIEVCVEEKPVVLTDDKPDQMILGDDFLHHYSAVIDYSKPAIYLIEPVKKEKRLQGKWRATTISERGEIFTEKEVGGCCLAIRDDNLTFFNNDKPTNYRLVVHTIYADKPVQMNWVPTDPELPKDAKATAIYRFDTDDTLTIALRGPTSKKGEFPTEFKSTKENGYTVITFKRAVAEKPKK